MVTYYTNVCTWVQEVSAEAGVGLVNCDGWKALILDLGSFSSLSHENPVGTKGANVVTIHESNVNYNADGSKCQVGCVGPSFPVSWFIVLCGLHSSNVGVISWTPEAFLSLLSYSFSSIPGVCLLPWKRPLFFLCSGLELEWIRILVNTVWNQMPLSLSFFSHFFNPSLDPALLRQLISISMAEENLTDTYNLLLPSQLQWGFFDIKEVYWERMQDVWKTGRWSSIRPWLLWWRSVRTRGDIVLGKGSSVVFHKLQGFFWIWFSVSVAFSCHLWRSFSRLSRAALVAPIPKIHFSVSALPWAWNIAPSSSFWLRSCFSIVSSSST